MPSAFTPKRKPARTFLVVTAVVLAVLALGFVLLVGLRSALATPATPTGSAVGLALATPTGWRGLGPPPTTGSVSHGPAGLPAIQPNAALAQAGGAGPYFTEADVRQYVATHRPYSTVPGTPNPVVVSVQFLTSKQASALVGGEEIAASDSTLVCLVFVSGTFSAAAWAGPGDTVAANATFTQGWMAFDAHTGNLLVETV
jgi:hypothetical protein